jgi:hypothetical protein
MSSAIKQMHAKQDFNFLCKLAQSGVTLEKLNLIRKIPVKYQLQIAKMYVEKSKGVSLGIKTESYFTEQEAINGFVFDGKLEGWELEKFNEL